jgi:hypothetical protein
MNVTLCRTTDVDLELDNLTSLDESYKTIPVLAITPLTLRTDEEEVYTEFEDALCKRATASRSCWKRLKNSASLSLRGQRILISFCCALNCVLLGFDLMGLLVLHMR